MQRRARLGLTAAILLLGGLQSAATPQVPPGYLASFRWTMDDPRFGGFSAIELSEDGQRLTVISDRGAWTEGTITRDAEGRITGVSAGPVRLLQATATEPLALGRRDSEGLAIAPDGTAYISLEGRSRVLRYADLSGGADNLPDNPRFRDFPLNGSLEAVAVDAAGRVFTLPEGRVPGTDAIPVFRYDGDWTEVFQIPRDASFQPVGADFGPDGRLYILERRFLGIGGFAARVRAMDVPDGGMAVPATVLETPPGMHDNLEGLTVWQDAAGRIRLTMIADDNFNFFQRTEIVEYLLPP
jgi:hypothetical protein